MAATDTVHNPSEFLKPELSSGGRFKDFRVKVKRETASAPYGENISTSTGFEEAFEHAKASLERNVLMQTNLAFERLVSPWIEEILSFRERMAELVANVSEKQQNSPTVSQAQIFSLPADGYQLLTPINVVLKHYNDEILAILPDFELVAEGGNEIEAINNLKLEFLDLFDDLNEMEDEGLGEIMKIWKKTINQLIEKCQ